MKRFLCILTLAFVAIICFENRAALLFHFVHNGMTEGEVVRLLGNGCSGRGFVVKGLVGTGSAHQTWVYRYHFLGFDFGRLPVRFEGDHFMLTHEA